MSLSLCSTCGEEAGGCACTYEDDYAEMAWEFTRPPAEQAGMREHRRFLRRDEFEARATMLASWARFDARQWLLDEGMVGGPGVHPRLPKAGMTADVVVGGTTYRVTVEEVRDVR